VFGLMFSCNTDNLNGDQNLKMASYNYEDAGMELSLNEEIVRKGGQSIVQDQKIIKTANLSFETGDLQATHQRILQLTKDNQGFIQNDNSGKNYGKEYVNLTIRVPSDTFEAMLEGISEGVGYFDQKQITQKDVTEEFVDINARLKAKRKLESRYLELLQQAKNVKEMLEIERELSKIREEIEAKEGRLKYLESQVSLSTMYVEFYKTTEAKGVSLSYGQKIANALKGGWNGISNFFLGILYIWPFIVILGVVIYFIRRYIKKRRKK